jgi:hypothetical protein
MRKANERLFHAVVLCIAGTWISGAEDGAGFFPEGGYGGYEFDGGHCDLIAVS